jgi:uncharacterized membrane protein
LSSQEPRPQTDPRWRLSPTKIVVTVLLLIAIVVPLLVSTYDSVDPQLFGFPFFYWYQLVWVFIAAGICLICYLLLRRERHAYEDSRRGDRTEAGR